MRVAFHFPVKSELKSCADKTPSDETSCVEKQIPVLKRLITDEISAIGIETFGHLDVALKAVIMPNSLPFGGVFLLVVEDISYNQKGMFMKSSKELFRLFNGWL